MAIGEWIRDLSGAALMLVAVLAMLKFLVGERKERSSLSEACHETHAKLHEKTDRTIIRTGDVIDSNTRMLGTIEGTLRKLNGG